MDNNFDDIYPNHEEYLERVELLACDTDNEFAVVWAISECEWDTDEDEDIEHELPTNNFYHYNIYDKNGYIDNNFDSMTERDWDDELCEVLTEIYGFCVKSVIIEERFVVNR